jgi:hypothetical protein
MDKKKKALQDVIRSETRRGKKPLNLEGLEEREKHLRFAKEALSLPTKEEFIRAMRAYGSSEEALSIAIQIWENYRP